MWTFIDCSRYSINFIDEPTIQIYVTDFITLWHVCLSPHQFLTALKESNALLTGSTDDVFIAKGKEILTTPENLARLDITPEDDLLSIYMVKSFGYPFKIKLEMLKSSKELFFERVTKPLLQTAEDLRKSESELKELLLRKDKEIERYKRENIQVLQYLKTPAFDEERHKEHYTQYSDTFGTANIPVHLLSKEIKCPDLQIKREIKEEDISASDTAVKCEVLNTESASTTAQVKLEPASQPFDETFTNIAENCIKGEIETKEIIKVESLSTIPMFSPRKKKKTWNI